MSKDLELAIEAAKEAGKIIRGNYTKAKTIIEKGVNDFLTETDTKAEEIIIAKLKQTGYSIPGEETSEIDNQNSKKWIIDPLDGTTLELCYIAKGSAEAFMSCGDKIYDYAGGLIIAKEAGADISDWNGKPWDNSNSYILALNPKIRDEIINCIKIELNEIKL